MPRRPERGIVRERKRSYELNGRESAALATIAAFRVVQVSDVREMLDDGRGGRSARKSLEHLQASGLLERIPLERRDDDVVVLTGRGRDLLEANRREDAGEPRQAFYAGLRNRKRAHRSRMIERLMLLDIVLDDRDVLWLGTESDKVRYFEERLARYRITPRELPHLTFGSGPKQVVRPFADKLPIGVGPLSDRYVFTYLVTRSSPQEFRSFLMRHYTLMRSLLRWTLRVFVPRKFEKAIAAFRNAVNEEFRRPLRPSDGEEALWFFRQRREATGRPAFVPDRRYLEAAKQFSAPRFAVLEKVWRLHRDDVIWNTYSKGIEDLFEIGRAAVEFTVIQRQYLHLAHLVGVA
jgi:hypothetical protein